jgi:hypothetical protein
MKLCSLTEFLLHFIKKKGTNSKVNCINNFFFVKITRQVLKGQKNDEDVLQIGNVIGGF